RTARKREQHQKFMNASHYALRAHLQVKSFWHSWPLGQSALSVQDFRPSIVTPCSTVDESSSSTRPGAITVEPIVWRVTITVGNPATPKFKSLVTSAAPIDSEPESVVSHSICPLLPP